MLESKSSEMTKNSNDKEGDDNKEGREDDKEEVYKTRRVVDDCKENRQQDYDDDNGVRRG